MCVRINIQLDLFCRFRYSNFELQQKKKTQKSKQKNWYIDNSI